MIFNYKTISVSRKVEHNLDKIELHKESIIRTANLNPDGSKIHNEVIDPALIEIVAENELETRTLKSIVQAASFYWDESRQLYLDNQLTRLVMYENGTGHKNRYLNYIPQIKSNEVPFRITTTESYVITYIQFDRSNATAGDIIAIRDVAPATPVDLYTLNAPTAELLTIKEDLNIQLNGGTNLALYVNDIRVDNPSVILGMRKIWSV